MNINGLIGTLVFTPLHPTAPNVRTRATTAAHNWQTDLFTKLRLYAPSPGLQLFILGATLRINPQTSGTIGLLRSSPPP
jgi:hypothetical protein